MEHPICKFNLRNKTTGARPQSTSLGDKYPKIHFEQKGGKWQNLSHAICKTLHSITMTSWWVRWRLKSPASRLFTQPFIQGTNKRKHQSSASLAFVRGIHRWPANSPHKRSSNAESVSIWWRHAAGLAEILQLFLGPTSGVLDIQRNLLI